MLLTNSVKSRQSSHLDGVVERVLSRTAGVMERGAAKAHSDSVNGMCFSGDGGYLVTYSMRDCIKVVRVLCAREPKQNPT